MTTYVTIGYTHSDDAGQVDAALVTAGNDGAHATGRLLEGSRDHGFACEYSEKATMPDGRPCYRMYLFTDEEVSAAGDDESNLPWDDAHTSRIILKD